MKRAYPALLKFTAFRLTVHATFLWNCNMSGPTQNWISCN